MVEVKPAATTCVLRETSMGSLEVLLLKRNKQLKFAPGFWVFPGGRVEPSELAQTASLKEASIIAAQRETLEETGLEVLIDGNTHYYHWTTPSGNVRRFGTWFYHSKIENPEEKIVIDRSEIVDYAWMSINEIFEVQKEGKFRMLPPTFITLQRLKDCERYDHVIAEFDRTGPIEVNPKVGIVDGVFHSMYPGDAGYDKHNAEITGIRHRLLGDLRKGTYSFQYSTECEVPSITGGIMF